jgi:predicted alpha/beta-hydrolase family hydrolase
VQVETPSGPARAHLQPADNAKGAVVLGHGAGGGVEAPDLTVAAEAASVAGFTVALVEQPYRVAGRRSPPTANRLDEAWVAVIEKLRADQLAGLPLVVGGRSLGARVACRTIEQTTGVAVLCLAFPLLPPRRSGKPPQSRLPELEAVPVPMLIVQGESDPFGMPPEGPNRKVARVAGNHGLKTDLDAVGEAVSAWLVALKLPQAVG